MSSSLILGALVYGPLGATLRKGLTSSRRALSSPSRVTAATLLLVLIVWGPAQLQGFGSWAVRNAAQYADEANYTREGLLIRAASGPTFRIAVVAAGATPYFSERPAEDLLGKNDSVIAPPRTERRVLARPRQVGLPLQHRRPASRPDRRAGRHHR